MNYKHRQSLYNHQKICKKIENINDTSETINAEDNIITKNDEKNNNNLKGVSNETINEILKQNHEIVDMLVEEQRS